MKKYAYQLMQPCYSVDGLQNEVVHSSPYRYRTALAALQAGIKAIAKSDSVSPDHCDYTAVLVRDSGSIVGIITTEEFRLYVD